jgi:hypothetical protein
MAEVMVWVGGSTCGAGGQTNVELDVLVDRVMLEPVGPCLEGESAILLEAGPSRARRSVVELGEDHVEGRLGDSIGEACVRNNALRSCGNKKVGVLGLQGVHERAVVGLDKVFVLGEIGGISLEIQVETINKVIANRTRSLPRSAGGSECTDKELGKPRGSIRVGQGVVRRGTSTEGKQDLLAVRTTDLDTHTNPRALRLKLALLCRIEGVWVDATPACVS